MRTDLPGCDFKNCKYFSDGNCVNIFKYQNCDYQFYKGFNNGVWEEQLDGTHYCSHCGRDATYSYDDVEICGVACTYCGAKMSIKE